MLPLGSVRKLVNESSGSAVSEEAENRRFEPIRLALGTDHLFSDDVEGNGCDAVAGRSRGLIKRKRRIPRPRGSTVDEQRESLRQLIMLKPSSSL